MNELLKQERAKLYDFLRIAHMKPNEQTIFIDACRQRLLDMDAIEERYDVNPLPNLMAEAALDPIET
jgi:hypothetical protein